MTVFKLHDLESKGKNEVFVLLDKLFIVEIEKIDDQNSEIYLTGNGGSRKLMVSNDEVESLKKTIGAIKK